MACDMASMALLLPNVVPAFLAGGATALATSALLPEMAPVHSSDHLERDAIQAEARIFAERDAKLQREADQRRQEHERKMQQMREEEAKLEQQRAMCEERLAQRRNEVQRVEQQLLQEKMDFQAFLAAAHKEHEEEELRMQRLLACLKQSRAERHQRQLELQMHIEMEWPKPEFLEGCREQVNLGVVGSNGAGKSSFINCLLGFKPGDPCGAKTGVTECTKEPTPLTKDNATFWDLPGPGGAFPPETYAKQMGLRYFDLLFIISHPRFSDTDQMLFREACKWQIPVYVVRSKADMDLERNLADNGVPPSETVRCLRQELIDTLKRDGGKGNQVFIISTRKDRFVEELEPELEALIKNISFEDAQEPRG